MSEQKQTKYIVITSLVGSDTTSLAKRIASYLNVPCIHMDEFAFGDNWYRKTYDEFKNGITTRINFLDCDTVVIEGVYCDVRKKYINEVIQNTKLIIYLKVDKITRVGRLIDRCINRAIGVDKGCCTETTLSRAKLLIKTIETDESLNNELSVDIEKFSKDGVNTKILENIDIDYPINNILENE